LGPTGKDGSEWIILALGTVIILLFPCVPFLTIIHTEAETRVFGLLKWALMQMFGYFYIYVLAAISCVVIVVIQIDMTYICHLAVQLLIIRFSQQTLANASR